MIKPYDVIVIGAGMIGACAALSLARHQFRIALVEPNPGAGEPLVNTDIYDNRVSAISPASQQILHDLGIWQALDQSRICRYEQMQVWHQAGQSRIQFDSAELAMGHLGVIIENRQLVNALRGACENQSQIDWYAPDEVVSLDENSDTGLSLTLRSGIRLQSELLLAADGRDSKMRTLAGLEVQGGSYQQTAIVANVTTELAHQSTAWQRFLSGGPLAFLPLANGDSSIVWSCDSARADELLALDEASFASALSDAIEYQLGSVLASGERNSFPLSWHCCERWIKHRVLLIGDAAHSVHPLAGQGVNLGFSDVDLLSRLLTNVDSPWSKLRAFERQRKSETMLATHLFTGLNWIYRTDNSVIACARDAGMALVQANAWCRRLLMRQAINNMA